MAVAAGDPSAVVGNDRGFWGTSDYYGNNRKAGNIDIGAHELATGTFKILKYPRLKYMDLKSNQHEN